MKIYHGLDEFKKLDFAVVTSGTFDGVHVGHQQIIKELVEEAKSSNKKSVLLTFFPRKFRSFLRVPDCASADEE